MKVGSSTCNNKNLFANIYFFVNIGLSKIFYKNFNQRFLCNFRHIKLNNLVLQRPVQKKSKCMLKKASSFQ